MYKSIFQAFFSPILIALLVVSPLSIAKPTISTQQTIQKLEAIQHQITQNIQENLNEYEQDKLSKILINVQVEHWEKINQIMSSLDELYEYQKNLLEENDRRDLLDLSFKQKAAQALTQYMHLQYEKSENLDKKDLDNLDNYYQELLRPLTYQEIKNLVASELDRSNTSGVFLGGVIMGGVMGFFFVALVILAIDDLFELELYDSFEHFFGLCVDKNCDHPSHTIDETNEKAFNRKLMFDLPLY